MTPKAFTARDFFVWLDQVRSDRALPVRSFVVAYTIGQHVNQTTGVAYPSQATIVAITGLNERTVRDAIHALETAGHLETGTLQGRGKGNRNAYRPRVGKPAGDCRFTRLDKPATFTGFKTLGEPAKSRSQTGKILPVPIELPMNQESGTPDPARRSALQARVPANRTVLR